MKKETSLLILVLILICAIFTSSCEVEDPPVPDPNPTNDTDYQLGWNGEDNLDEIPGVPNFGNPIELPSSVDLVSKFPPIGDQGQYGTCVSWAVAYNVKTAVNGMDNGLSVSQLSLPSNQFSPKDLFTAIPDDKKSPNCSGTDFSNALSVLQERGVASMQTVPYNSLGDCSQYNLESSWTNEASQNKIKYWRKIEADVEIIKQNLANNIPIILGAKLSDNFMTWSSDNVLSSNTSYNTVGQHSYHALVIAGYDDNRGPNGAFKVINSWGEFWGDGGYIWIDYNFMVNEFCNNYRGDKPLFIVANDEGNVSPPDNPDQRISGVDLAPWVFSDLSTYQSSGNVTEREIIYNIYNIGDQVASPNSNWSYYYIYFNAYNVNDYGVLFYDDFNTSIENWDCPITNNNCIFNYSIPSGGNFTQTVWGAPSVIRPYYMPPVTGQYYLVMIADAGGSFAEQNELNNLFYTTSEPKYFTNGYSAKRKEVKGGETRESTDFKFENPSIFSSEKLVQNPFNTVVSSDHPNAYTQEEISSFVKQEYLKGNLGKKIKEFKEQLDDTPFRN